MNWNKLPAFIDDALTTLTSLWSSKKINDEIENVKSHIDEHSARVDNPHAVTASQVGAETPSGAQAKVNVVQANLTNHTERTDNPHMVTAAQVGAETPTGAQAKANAVQVNLATHIATGTHSFVTGVSDKPTTLAGYGISNAYTKTEMTNLLAAKASLAATLAGYGITDAYTKPQTDANIAAAVAALVNSAPETLNTINELANAINDDPNFASTMLNLVGTKLNASDVVASAAANKVLRLDANGKFPWAVLANVPSSFTPAAHNQAWSTITSTPTTLDGYGITDAYTKAALDVVTNNHLNSTTAHAAMNITNAPGSIVKSVNVQNAVDELANYNGFAATQIGAEQGELGVEIKGRTLVNLLGKDGNFEVDTDGNGMADGWGLGSTAHWSTTALDTDAYIGTKSQKLVGSGNGSYTSIAKNYAISASKYYVLLANVKSPNATVCYTRFGSDSGGLTFAAHQISSSWSTICRKLNPTIDATMVQFYTAQATPNTNTFYFDGARLYEISQAEFNAIDSMTADQVAAKYPYVDSVQFKKDVLVTQIGKNLIPAFNSGEWTLHANAVVNSAYNLTLNATTISQVSRVPVSLKPNTNYVLSGTATGGNSRFVVQTVKADGSSNYFTLVNTYSSLPFTTPTDFVSASVFITNDTTTSGTFTFTNPQLELGSTATAFEPQVKSYAHTPMQIADGESVWLTPNTSVYKEVWKKNVQLPENSSSIAGVDVSYTGAKRVLMHVSTKFITDSEVVVKYDGKPLTHTTQLGNTWNAGDMSRIHTDIELGISVYDIDSGWNSSFTPTIAEIKAYFYGWKMCASDGGTYVSGTKYWKKITDGTGITSTLPTASYSGYTPYVLHYKLATPVYHINYYNNDPTKPIMSAGSVINIPQGVTQIEQRNGVVWREKSNPKLYSSAYYINSSGLGSLLAYRPKLYLACFKNGIVDITWNTHASDTLEYYTAQSNYDTTAIYTVTYEQLDKYLYAVDTFAIDNPVPTRQRNFALDSTEQKIAYFKINPVDLVGATANQHPKTLADYGILDAYTKDIVDAAINTKLNSSNSLANGTVYKYRDVTAYHLSGTTTGTVKIMLPTSWLSTTLVLSIEGWSSAGTNVSHWDATVSGYTQGSGNWILTAATLHPNCPFSSVRFGYDSVAGKCCILLGTATTAWDNIKIVVEAFIGNSNVASYGAGWNISVITDESSITNIVTPTVKTLATIENPVFINTTAINNSSGNPTLNFRRSSIFTANSTLGYLAFYGGNDVSASDVQYAGIYATTTGYTAGAESGALVFLTRSSGAVSSKFVVDSGSARPYTDNSLTLGTSGARWSQIYAVSATINTSDRNAKKDITDLDLGLDFINSLRPVEFKYKVRQNEVASEQCGVETVEIEPERTEIQEVSPAIYETVEVSPAIYSTIEIIPAEYDEEGNLITEAVTETILEKEAVVEQRLVSAVVTEDVMIPAVTEERPVYKEVVIPLPGVRTHAGLIAQEVEEALNGKDVGIFTVDEQGNYGLRYEEFIAPLIKAVQELSAKVERLERQQQKEELSL